MAILVTVTHIQSSFYTLVTCIRLGTADIAAEITTHNDIFSAFSNAALMNHCVGHQIQTNCYFSQIEMNFAYSSISGVSRAPQQ